MFEPRIYESVVTRLKLVSIEDFNKLKDENDRQRALIEELESKAIVDREIILRARAIESGIPGTFPYHLQVQHLLEANQELKNQILLLKESLKNG